MGTVHSSWHKRMESHEQVDRAYLEMEAIHLWQWEKEAHSYLCRDDRCLGNVSILNLTFFFRKTEKKASLAHGSLKKFWKREQITCETLSEEWQNERAKELS